uniref:HTH CENPB-type domain-containing protein n=1 Tax=Romanomermis culicivorax TaxID=13658 RepID=A0A915IKC9_ROMCU
MELSLQCEILERREKCLTVTRKWVMLRAKALSDQNDFQASRGWLQKFLQRSNLMLCRRTTISQKLPKDVLPKLTDFVIYVRKLQMKNSYSFDSIYACDEKAVWLDMLSDSIMDVVGTKQVPIKTSGHEKMRITVMLCAKLNGIKCKPFVLFK